jgi:hypothetical protein
MPRIQQFDEDAFNQENSPLARTEEAIEDEISCIEQNNNSLFIKFDFDSEDSQLASREKSCHETQNEYPKQIKQSWLEQWMKPILPFLKPGGKTVALILALGVVSIPLLMMSGSVWVATILAVGCTIVAIFK